MPRANHQGEKERYHQRWCYRCLSHLSISMLLETRVPYKRGLARHNYGKDRHGCGGLRS